MAIQNLDLTNQKFGALHIKTDLGEIVIHNTTDRSGRRVIYIEASQRPNTDEADRPPDVRTLSGKHYQARYIEFVELSD